MREILVNALIHRDYSIEGGAVSLAIFDDRVEVWSAGVYPIGITPDMLSRDHQSVQRNPIIADVFHRTGLIEKWGRGTNRVIEMCKAAGVAPPEFEEITGAAVVRFRVNVAGFRRATDRTPREFGEGSEKTREKTREKILRAIKADPEITTAELAHVTRLTTKGIEWNLKNLKDAGVLKRIGPDKGGRWEVAR